MVGSLTDYCRPIPGAPLPEKGLNAAGYHFRNGPPRARDLNSAPCERQRADTFFAADGTVYDITALDDEKLKELVELAGNNTSEVNYLEMFQGLTLRK